MFLFFLGRYQIKSNLTKRSLWQSQNNCTAFINRRLGKLARTIKINTTQGKCERCGGVGEKVHHQIRLTLSNLGDIIVSLDQSNLELLCNDCYNTKHDRFNKQKIMFDKDGNFID